MKDPAFVEVSHKGETADTIDQFMIPVGPMKKPALLRLVLQQRGSKRVIVFADTKTRAEDMHRPAEACRLPRGLHPFR